MSEKGAAIAKFKSKLEILEGETGCAFDIVYPKFEEALENNRLFADWFDPGTVIARATNGSTVITYDIVGDLEARIDTADHEPVRSFDGRFKPVNDPATGLIIENDTDIKALKEKRHASGCLMTCDDNNKLRISVNNEDVGEIVAADPSVARGILNKEFVTELLKAAEREDDEEPGIHKLGSELPDTYLDPEVAAMDKPFRTDIPEYDEYAADQEERATSEALERAKEAVEADSLPDMPAKKEPKKAEKEAKKPAKKEKKSSAKKKAPEEEPAGRFDLLPLDVIADFLTRFDEAKEGDFLRDIEAYKKKGEGLLDAAVSFAKGYFKDGPDAVMKLAVIAEEEASENGEDSLMEGDVTACINSAVKDYLLFLQKGCDEKDYFSHVLWALICGASREGRK